MELFRGFLDRKSTFELPQFIRDIPVLGPWLDDYVRALLAGSSAELAAFAGSFVEPGQGASWSAMGKAVGPGPRADPDRDLRGVLLLPRRRARAPARCCEGVRALAGPEHGVALIATAQNAVKGVVYGLIGTAFAQAAVAFVGFLIAGVPGRVPARAR